MMSSATQLGASPQTHAVAGKSVVMFVDDEERILRSLKMMFRSDYAIKTATSGQAALEIVKHEKVHVVVSDQRMPSMQGVELLREVKNLSPNTMRLLLTGYSDLQAVIDSINEGEIFRYISKPWNTDDIRGTVAKAVEIAHSLDQIEIPAVQTEEESAERILVVDKDPDVAAMIKEIVEEEFEQLHAVEWASDLNSIFEILEKTEVAVILSEIHLAEHDITPLLKTLKRYNPHVITMVLTSFRDTGALVNLINQGQVHRFLPKPIRRGLVAKSLRDALVRYRNLKATPALIQRHQVEEAPASAGGEESPVSKRIVGFMKRLRRNFQ